MFAGLPGIGVGTLFYVLIALWMPIREVGFIARGKSSLKRWRLIGTQLIFSAGILGSIALADRVLVWTLGASTPRAVGPARWLNERLGTDAPDTILAAPIMASVLLLVIVLLLVEAARLMGRLVHGAPTPVLPTATLPVQVPQDAVSERMVAVE